MVEMVASWTIGGFVAVSVRESLRSTTSDTLTAVMVWLVCTGARDGSGVSLDCGKVKSGGEGQVGVGGYDPAEGADVLLGGAEE